MASIRLHYRHVDQAERWKRVEMQGDDRDFHRGDSGRVHAVAIFRWSITLICAAKSGAAWLEPAFNATLSNQPYYTVMRQGRLRIGESGRTACAVRASRKTQAIVPVAGCTGAGAMRYPDA